MKTVAQVLTNKSHEIYSTNPSATVMEAVKVMAEKKVGALLVMEADRVIGMISEQDYTRKIVLHDRQAEQASVKDVMSQPVIIIRPGQSIQEGMAIMTEKRIRHLPVMEDGKLVGLVSIGDLVKEVISEQQFIIEQLESYIQG